MNSATGCLSTVGAYYTVLFLCRVITAIGAEGVFLVPFTLSMEIVGGKQTMGLLPWVTFKTLLGTGLDH